MGKSVSEKLFKPVESCCPKKCFENIHVCKQEESFSAFWRSGQHETQNVSLASMMTQKPTQGGPRKNPDKPVILWDYHFHCQTENWVVCKNFLCKLYQVHKSRFETLRKKLLKGESLADKRGQHENHRVLLTDTVKELIQVHCESIPHSESHYDHESSSLKYFDNPDLTITALYDLFVDYYCSVTGTTNIPLDISTYCKYFNENVNFTFSKPRTDVCNICFENERNMNLRDDVVKHKENVKLHSEMKKAMLSEERVLRVEFDFGQNLPLPKIPVSEQFYKRLLWLHIFNVHVFNSHNRSYMFTFMEGFCKKGGNTVCNLVFDAIKREIAIEGCFDKIYLFSDSCGGQNKNHYTLAFFSLLSKYLQLEIQHLFPVRGHSYCQCDRNFGMYGQRKAHKEVIETADEYCEMIENCRKSPFIVIKQHECKILDFELQLKENCPIPKDLKISKAVKIVYYPNGQVNLFEKYDNHHAEYLIRSDMTFAELLNNSLPVECVGITAEKIKDVKSLLRYVSEKHKTYYTSMFGHVKQKPEKKVANDSEMKKGSKLKKENTQKQSKEKKGKKTAKNLKKNVTPKMK